MCYLFLLEPYLRPILLTNLTKISNHDPRTTLRRPSDDPRTNLGRPSDDPRTTLGRPRTTSDDPRTTLGRPRTTLGRPSDDPWTTLSRPSNKTKCVSNDRSGHDDSNGPRIVKIGALLAIFRLFESSIKFSNIEIKNPPGDYPTFGTTVHSLYKKKRFKKLRPSI